MKEHAHRAVVLRLTWNTIHSTTLLRCCETMSGTMRKHRFVEPELIHVTQTVRNETKHHNLQQLTRSMAETINSWAGEYCMTMNSLYGYYCEFSGKWIEFHRWGWSINVSARLSSREGQTTCKSPRDWQWSCRLNNSSITSNVKSL